MWTVLGVVMQRSKAVEVRQVIGALCRLLAATGLEAVPAPETFRRAKFGGRLEVENHCWQLLSNILQTVGIVSCEAHAQLRGDHRKLVVAGLWQTGYHADWMFGNEEGGFSSRDLLLALGWLLATGTLEKLLTQQVQQLDRTHLAPTPLASQLSNELQFDSASLRKLQWLTGCLRFQRQILLSMQDEQTRLLHAVHLVSPPCSVLLTDQSSAVLSEHCVCVQQLCDLLEAYLKWKKEEKVFWTWMDSVVDCYLTDQVVKKPTHAASGSASACHRGIQGLDNMLVGLPTGQKGQRRGERLQHLSDSSLVLLSSSLSFLPFLPHVYQARLQTERPVKHSRHRAERPCGGDEAPDKLTASQAVQLLLQTQSVLLESKDRQRMANRMQLQEMVSRLNEPVLIPP